jgi:hypothetical protein
MRRFHAWVAMLGILLAPSAPADLKAQVPESPPSPSSQNSLRVFLDCQTRCDADFLRTEVDFVDYVRDRQGADVHVLITSQPTGAGGSEYTLRFVGQNGFSQVSDDLRFSSSPGESPDQVRRSMAQMIKAGLIRYSARRPGFEQMMLSLAPAAQPRGPGSPGETASARDPWNNWVLRASLGGFANGEASYKTRSLNGSLSANRTTLGWKNVLTVSARSSRNETNLGTTTIVNQQSDRTASTLVVKSLSDHWSAGGRTNFNHSTFLNRDLSVRVAPAVEFNVFPYSESTRRQLTLQYSVGANQISYLQETIYGKFEESLLDHTLGASWEMRQRWGNVRASTEAAHYFHDPGKYRLLGQTNFDLRLVRGLSINFGGSAERVRDQLHLAKGQLTAEQILIRQRQIETAYRYFGSLGLSYSFGSIYSAVVNPRMGGSGPPGVFNP